MVKEEDNSRTKGYEDRQYPFVLYNHVALTHKTMMQLLFFVFSFDVNKS